MQYNIYVDSVFIFMLIFYRKYAVKYAYFVENALNVKICNFIIPIYVFIQLK